MIAPLLSIVIPTKSREDVNLKRFLRSLQRQTFQDFELRIETEGNSEEAKGKAVLKAKGEIVGFFCTDNDLRDPYFLADMVGYARLPGCTGAYPAQYDYVLSDASLSRYFALLGANDPVCWWLGKADRHSYFKETPRTSQKRTFLHTIPSLGDNGFFIKRTLLLQAGFIPSLFGSCMCVCEDLRRQGHATYWLVAEQKLWHRTGEDILDYFKRRWRYANELYFDKLPTRRWRMVDTPRDWGLVCLFTICSLLVVPQLLVSIRGYRQKPDWAWGWHPLICFTLTLLYTWALMRHLLSRLLSRPWSVRRN